jgi:hypothetical protein
MSRPWLAAAALALAVPIGAAQAQEDCAPLSPHFVLCGGTGPWSRAEWRQFGDGASIHADGLWLDFNASWSSRDPAHGLEMALDAVLARIAEAEDAPLDIRLRDVIQTPDLRVARSMHVTPLPEGHEPLLVMVMIAEAAGERILLMMGHDEVITPDDLDRATRALVAAIRPERKE